MPRPRKIDPPIAWHTNVPRSLAAEVELLLLDPTTGKPKYGGRGGLIEMLLREWVAGMKREEQYRQQGIGLHISLDTSDEVKVI